MAGKSKKVKGTKQTLEYIEEPKKLHVKQLKCMNARQKEFVRAIEQKEIVVCEGPAGAGKTYVAVACALKMLEKKQIEQIVLVKSVTTINSEDIGLLPGTIYEKMDPFMMSFFGNIDKIIGEEERRRLVGEHKIVIQPICYLRGVNIDNACVLLDEAQNISLYTFKTIITRIGKDSRYIIMGDSEQCDMSIKEQSSLSKIMEVFNDDPYIGVVKFNDEDCVRNQIIPHVLTKIRALEEQEFLKKQQKKSKKIV